MNAFVKELIARGVSLIALLVLAPLFAILLFLVWLSDRHTPFYIAERA